MSTFALHPTNLGDEFVEHRQPYQAHAPSQVRQFRILKDSDRMPFGPFKDRRMDEVPASYLDRLRDANWLTKWPAVEEYIERNARAIDKELDEQDRRRS